MAAGGDEKGIVKALIAGVVANFGLGVVKIIAYFATSSASMLAEGLHSMADSSNQFLLLVGLKRSKREATEEHPFGHTKERYFWSFLVALMIFALGGSFAIYEGVHKTLHPVQVEDPTWIYIALGLGLIFESYALSVAWKEFQHFRKDNPGPLLQNLKETKDPTLPTVLFEDTAAILGLLIALTGVSIAQITGNGIWDGLSSISIGVLLIGVSWFLAKESHSLLVGEAASARDRKAIHEVIDQTPAVKTCVELLTLQRSPTQVLVALTLEFNDELSVDDLEDAVIRIETAIRERVAGAEHIFIEAGSWRTRRDPTPDE